MEWVLHIEDFKLRLLESNPMQYHIVDERWKLFGYNTFEEYLKSFVYVGKFHQLVPKEIVESYKVIEYIMAHAYYYYPLYDEAILKILMLMEMAVKTRCKQLSIPLSYSVQKSNGLKDIPKDYNQLINDCTALEPLKSIKENLHSLRNSRNYSAHKDTYSYSGAVGAPAIIRCINLINTLFLAESTIQLMKKKVKSIKQKFDELAAYVLVLNYQNKKYLLEKVIVEQSINLANGWRYLLICYPIILNIDEEIKAHKYSMPIVLEIDGLIISENDITGIEYNTRQPIAITKSEHPQDVSKYKDFIKAKKSNSITDLSIYDLCLKHEVAKNEAYFLYKNLCFSV